MHKKNTQAFDQSKSRKLYEA